ncbi:MAG: ABC transporter permease [Candidatus Zophobacter franzmannii]|nr:ABC transporter permease [Candidatus Zophobacter franzmannii]
MKWSNLYKIAIKSIMKNKMRSLLTSLGIIIGVSSVIVMVAIGEGSQRRIKESFSSMGTNMLMISPNWRKVQSVSKGASGGRNSLTYDDIEELKISCPSLSGVSAIIKSSGQLIGGTGNWSTSVEGVDPDYFLIRNWDLSSGRIFTKREVESKKKVCIIGKTVADELFQGIDPFGQKLRIRNTPFKIIGVLDSKGQNSWGQDQDDIVLAPSKTVLYRLKGRRDVDRIYVSATSDETMSIAEEEIDTALRKTHKLAPGEDPDFRIRNQSEMVEMASETSKTLTMLLGSIAGVSLLVGGIGIMNIMLVSVTERTREIGIRLSLGARSKDVLMQFLTEAIVLSLTGGAIGIILSFLIAHGLTKFTELVPYINPWVVFSAFTFSGAVGIFFGFYPAKKAANLNPIDALRYE